jgi:hypothetical protein
MLASSNGVVEGLTPVAAPESSMIALRDAVRDAKARAAIPAPKRIPKPGKRARPQIATPEKTPGSYGTVSESEWLRRMAVKTAAYDKAHGGGESAALLAKDDLIRAQQLAFSAVSSDDGVLAPDSDQAVQIAPKRIRSFWKRDDDPSAKATSAPKDANSHPDHALGQGAPARQAKAATAQAKADPIYHAEWAMPGQGGRREISPAKGATASFTVSRGAHHGSLGLDGTLSPRGSFSARPTSSRHRRDRDGGTGAHDDADVDTSPVSAEQGSGTGTAESRATEPTGDSTPELAFTSQPASLEDARAAVTRAQTAITMPAAVWRQLAALSKTEASKGAARLDAVLLRPVGSV